MARSAGQLNEDVGGRDGGLNVPPDVDLGLTELSVLAEDVLVCAVSVDYNLETHHKR